MQNASPSVAHFKDLQCPVGDELLTPSCSHKRAVQLFYDSYEKENTLVLNRLAEGNSVDFIFFWEKIEDVDSFFDDMELTFFIYSRQYNSFNWTKFHISKGDITFRGREVVDKLEEKVQKIMHLITIKEEGRR